MYVHDAFNPLYIKPVGVTFPYPPVEASADDVFGARYETEPFTVPVIPLNESTTNQSCVLDVDLNNAYCGSHPKSTQHHHYRQ